MCISCTLLAMTLDAYLTERKIKDAQFAPFVGCDRTTIYRIRKGQRPSAELLLKIVDETGGLVQPNDFYRVAA